MFNINHVYGVGYYSLETAALFNISGNIYCLGRYVCQHTVMINITNIYTFGPYPLAFAEIINNANNTVNEMYLIGEYSFYESSVINVRKLVASQI